jgi:hypothetical protein
MSELSSMPTWEMNRFALWAAKAAMAYLEDPEVKKRFDEWKKERELKNAVNNI